MPNMLYGVVIRPPKIDTVYVSSNGSKAENMPGVIKVVQEKDFVAVVKYQGPKSNGMPELHGLLPALGVLQDKGFNVAIVTDGRMSGASGKVPSAIHMVSEAAKGGVISLIRDNDIICLDVLKGELHVEVTQEELTNRKEEKVDVSHNVYGFGRDLFSSVRYCISSAEEGASIFDLPGEEKN